MLVTIATVLAGLIGAGIIFIGARVFWAPQGAEGFGIPDTPTGDRTFHAWLTVKGVRDMASGVVVFVLMAAAGPQVLGWYVLAASGIPFGDALIVLRSKGPRAAAYGIHGATAAVMVAISVVLLLG
ncbi:DUF4267 domain-containing protein [Actinosynnema sp. NPDC059797]